MAVFQVPTILRDGDKIFVILHLSSLRLGAIESLSGSLNYKTSRTKF